MTMKIWPHMPNGVARNDDDDDHENDNKTAVVS